MKRANSSHRLLPLLGLALALAFPATANAWWKSEWTMRKKIVVDTSTAGGAITEPIGNAPVLLRLHDGNFSFTAAKQDGSDIRIVAADDLTPLAFHLEKFDPLLNEAFVWVKVPDLKPGAQATFWLYYGNNGSSVARADDVKGTYDNDTVLVYHFAERGTPPSDASGSGINAQNPGVPAEGAMIGGGLRLDGRTAVTIPGAPALAWAEGGAMTWSAWVKVGGAQPRAAIFRRVNGGNAFIVGIENGAPFVEVHYPRGVLRTPGTGPVALNGWHHFAVVVSPNTLTFYVDGETRDVITATLPPLDGPAVVGGEAETPAGAGFVGEIDELQISKTARSPGFIKFAARAQGADATGKLIAIGEDEQPKSWFSFLKTGYVGVIIGSLSVDGWVVIGILIVMAIISWAVMIGKARYLTKVGKGNAAFLAQWRQVASDLSVLDNESDDHAKSMGGRVDAATTRLMRDAPLFHVYHIGVEEIRHRLKADRSSKVLSARSIQAIRAALDGGLVRESHRLSSQMVLLTIAISGGPFLGLLGTVVGVMITFAAVAAAGDVNVNAIAPGIAAALAATVAGLAVAIPSLFGYNYLLTRIKGATSDLHVFIDEFVAKMAEFYSETAEANRTITRAPFAPSEPAAARK